MGILRNILLAPALFPMQGTVWIASKIAEAAEADFLNPALIREAIAALEADFDAGKMTEAEFEAAEGALFARLRLSRERQA